MKLQSTRQLLTAFSIAGALAFVAACSGPSSSLSPTGPTSMSAASGASGANFSPNPGEPPPPPPPPPPCEPPNEIDPETGECVPPPPPPPPPGDEGCTPGYWKNHADSWPPTGYSPSQDVSTVFTGSMFGDSSLLEALGFGGGSGVAGAQKILLRAAVAALLNAAHPDVAYTQSTASVIASVNAALASGDRDTMLTLAGRLDTDNNLGCPLN